MWQALIVSAHGAMLEIRAVGKRYFWFCMSPIQKVWYDTSQPHPIITLSPKPAWETEKIPLVSMISYLESLDNYLHYGLISLILYYFWVSEECLKPAIFGVKWGGPRILSPRLYKYCSTRMLAIFTFFLSLGSSLIRLASLSFDDYNLRSLTHSCVWASLDALCVAVEDSGVTEPDRKPGICVL